MRIAYIFGTCATPDSPAGGSYIYERLNQLKQKGISVSTYFVEEFLPSKIINLVYRLAKGSDFVTYHQISWKIADREYVIKDNIGLISLVLYLFFNKSYWKRRSSLYIKDTDMDEVDIIHSHWAFPQGYIGMNIAKRLGKPCVITAHGSDIHTMPKTSRKIKKYTITALESADKVIFVSRDLLDTAINLGYSGKNAVVIPNGIDSSLFFPMKKMDAFHQTGWKKTSKYVVGYVGRLTYVKRGDKFAELFLKIKEKIHDVEFILIGTGDFSSSIASECKKYNIKVTFTGAIPHESVVAWMNLFDVLILPSRNEAWGCTIREAYACRVPVVASAVGGIPEAVGNLCPIISEGSDFIDKFSDAVIAVLLGTFPIDKEKLVEKSLEYSWTNCVDNEVEVYNSVLK